LRSLIKKFAAAASGRRTYLEDATDKDILSLQYKHIALPLSLSPSSSPLPLSPLSLSPSLFLLNY
jgi:hypothetical protein